MGIINRIGQIFKAKANNTLDNIENPIELLDQQIREKTEAIGKVKISSSELIGSVETLEKQIEDKEKSILAREELIKKEMAKDNKDGAKKILEIVQRLKNEKSIMEQNLIVKKEETTKIQNSIKKLESNIKTLKEKRETLKARYETSKASVSINEMMADVNKENISINEIEERVTRQENKAKGLETFQEKSDEEIISEVVNSDENLDELLEQYK